MVTRQFCSDNGQAQLLADFANNSRRDVGATGAATAKNGENTNAGRRPSLASRAGALVRQMSSRATSSLAAVSAESQSQPSPPPASAKMALFHTRTATVHVENGEWSLALKSYNRALIHHRQLHGQDSAPCATTLNGIGVCLMNLAIGGDSDEESILCRDYVRYAECALREALYIRERIFGTDSDEAEEVEINLELLLGPNWNDGQQQPPHAGDAAFRNSTSGSAPPSRSGGTDSLSGNNFQRAARRLFGSGGNGGDDNTTKRDNVARSPASGNDTASSSSASHSSSTSSSLSSQEEQIDFQYPLGATLSSMAKIRQSPPTSLSSSNKSVDSSLHSTGSFGRTDEDAGEDLDDDDVAVQGVIDEIDLWALDDSSGDEMEQRPARACNVLFASVK